MLRLDVTSLVWAFFRPEEREDYMEVRKEDQRDQDEKVVEIEIERLRDFKNHPFKVQADRQMKPCVLILPVLKNGMRIRQSIRRSRVRNQEHSFVQHRILSGMLQTCLVNMMGRSMICGTEKVFQQSR